MRARTDAETTDEVASAYAFPDLYSAGDLGSGTTVALYELQGYGANDIAAYQSCYGTDASVTTVDVDGGPAENSGVGEADVDIEQVAGLAPDAHILVYEGPNTDAGAYDTYNAIVSDDQALDRLDLVGRCASPRRAAMPPTPRTSLFEEAASQGQGVFAAAGDQGSEDCLSNGYSERHRWPSTTPPASRSSPGSGGRQWSTRRAHRRPRRPGTTARPAAGERAVAASRACGPCPPTRVESTVPGV